MVLISVPVATSATLLMELQVVNVYAVYWYLTILPPPFPVLVVMSCKGLLYIINIYIYNIPSYS